MSFSFIVIDKSNNINLPTLVEYLNNNYADYELLYCGAQQIAKQEKIKAFCFDADADVESILNAVTSQCIKDNIVVVRQFVSCEQIKTLTDKLNQNAVVYYKKGFKGIKKFFINILNKLAKLFYAKSAVFADHSAMAFGLNPSRVLKQLEYPSNLMRVFSWSGVQLIQLNGDNNYKLNYSKTSSILKTFIPLAISVVLIALFVLFKNKLDILVNVIIWLTVLICFTLFVLFGTNWFIKSQIGENKNQKAKIKNKGDNKNEKN